MCLQPFVFHRIPSVGVPTADAGLEMCSECIVDASGAIPVHLVADGTDRPFQLLCNVSQGTSFLEKNGNDGSLVRGQFLVMCHINLRVEDSPQVFGFVLELGIFSICCLFLIFCGMIRSRRSAGRSRFFCYSWVLRACAGSEDTLYHARCPLRDRDGHWHPVYRISLQFGALVHRLDHFSR